MAAWPGAFAGQPSLQTEMPTSPRDHQLPQHDGGAPDTASPSVSAVFADAPRQRFARGEILLRAGNGVPGIYLVTEGCAIPFKLLSNGRRQILEFCLPGDITGFIAWMMPVNDRNIAALSDLEVAFLAADELEAMRQAGAPSYDAITAALLALLPRFTEHVTRLGARSAPARVAHLILELQHRLEGLGLAEDDRLALPLTQDVIADALCFSAVHLNRTIRQLEQDGLIRYRRRGIEISDTQALIQLAEFDPGYLLARRSLA